MVCPKVDLVDQDSRPSKLLKHNYICNDVFSVFQKKNIQAEPACPISSQYLWTGREKYMVISTHGGKCTPGLKPTPDFTTPSLPRIPNNPHLSPDTTGAPLFLSGMLTVVFCCQLHMILESCVFADVYVIL